MDGLLPGLAAFLVGFLEPIRHLRVALLSIPLVLLAEIAHTAGTGGACLCTAQSTDVGAAALHEWTFLSIVGLDGILTISVHLAVALDGVLGAIA